MMGVLAGACRRLVRWVDVECRRLVRSGDGAVCAGLRRLVRSGDVGSCDGAPPTRQIGGYRFLWILPPARQIGGWGFLRWDVGWDDEGWTDADDEKGDGSDVGYDGGGEEWSCG